MSVFRPAKMLHAKICFPAEKKDAVICSLSELGVCQIRDQQTKEDLPKKDERIQSLHKRIARLLELMVPQEEGRSFFKNLVSSPQKIHSTFKSNQGIIDETINAISGYEEEMLSIDERQDMLSTQK